VNLSVLTPTEGAVVTRCSLKIASPFLFPIGLCGRSLNELIFELDALLREAHAKRLDTEETKKEVRDVRERLDCLLAVDSGDDARPASGGSVNLNAFDELKKKCA
jgi:hypothetical protein